MFEFHPISFLAMKLHVDDCEMTVSAHQSNSSWQVDLAESVDGNDFQSCVCVYVCVCVCVCVCVLGAVCTREPISMVSYEDLRSLDPTFDSGMVRSSRSISEDLNFFK